MTFTPASEDDIALYTRVAGCAHMLEPYVTVDGFAYGFGDFLNPKRGLPVTDRKHLLHAAHIAERAAMFRRCLEFLNDAPFAGVVTRTVTSYGLKHWAERPDFYIANGVMILAMIRIGWDLKCDGLNAVVPVPKEIRAAALKADRARLRAAEKAA